MTSNWRKALAGQTMISAGDLIVIGVVLGPDLAERVYRSLREEPRSVGGPVDWITIAAEIHRQAPRDVYRVKRTG